MQSVEEALEKLKRSAFRARFHLTEADRAYIAEKKWETLSRHAADFVARKLAPAFPENDGRQTPMHGHPVFKAMHACACCCRGCLEKWYRVPKGIPLTQEQQERIVRLLLAWISRQTDGEK